MEIKITNLKKQFGKLVLFKDFSTFISGSECIGIFGENGAGKTTLLDMFAKNASPTLGKIEFSQEPKTSYFEQNDLEDFEQILKEVKTNLENNEYKFISLVNGLNVENSEFSAGEKAKIYLTKIVNENADLYLFDEPTNHLDQDSILQLAQIIKNLNGVKFIASHEENFLKLVSSKIWFLKNNSIEIYKGDFEKFWDKKTEEDEQTEKKFKEVMRKIERLRDNDKKRQEKFSQNKKLKNSDPVKVFRKKFKFIHQNQVYKKRVRRLLNEELPTLPKEKQKLLLEFAYSPFESSEPLMIIDKLGKYFGRIKVFGNINFQIEPKEKILVTGKNGAGKTTLLRILAELERDFEGKITKSENLNLAYFKQENFDDLNYENSVFEEFVKFVLDPNHDTFNKVSENHNIDETQVLEQIKYLEFDDKYLEQKIEDLSEGEKIKLRFAKLLLLEPNLLLLDEPTNHLDARNKTGVLQAIKNFKEAIVVVSHDPEVINLLNWDYVISL